MISRLPNLSSVFIPAMLTIRKSKRIDQAGIHLDMEFTNVEIELDKLDRFKKYFGFKTEVPLCYFYSIAQRAQAAVMLDQRFTLPIPGMVHIENHLKKEHDFDRSVPVDITASVSVDYRATGSLTPRFKVEILQNGKPLVNCGSTYLVKRTSKHPRTNKTPPEIIQDPEFETTWNLQPRNAKEYAKISGDRNPIHTSVGFAKLLGFKTPILHGWYSVCKVEQSLEEVLDMEVSEIAANFLSPVYLPSQPMMRVKKHPNGTTQFQVIRDNESGVILSGVVF